MKVVDKMFNLYNELINNYKSSEPILLKDLKFNNVSYDAIRQQLKTLTDNGKINRFDDGIYYFGNDIDLNLVLEHKYIKRNDNIFGFYSGKNLAIELGIINEKLDLEIITNEFKPIVRNVIIGNENVKLRHSNLKIDSNNCYVLRLLDMLKRINLNNITNENKSKLKEYINKYGIQKEDIDKYIGDFPRKTYKNVYILGINEMF